jgi:putative FmdB family regulatory protein
MPIYEYLCAKCGEFETSQRITDEPLKRCPTCRSKVKKLISNTSFQLKGSGWYITDYGRKDAGAGKDGGASKDGDKGKSDSSTKSESTSSDTSSSDTTSDTTSTDKKATKKSPSKKEGTKASGGAQAA